VGAKRSAENQPYGVERKKKKKKENNHEWETYFRGKLIQRPEDSMFKCQIEHIILYQKKKNLCKGAGAGGEFDEKHKINVEKRTSKN